MLIGAKVLMLFYVSIFGRVEHLRKMLVLRFCASSFLALSPLQHDEQE